jgi:hypothetical protein
MRDRQLAKTRHAFPAGGIDGLVERNIKSPKAPDLNQVICAVPIMSIAVEVLLTFLVVRRSGSELRPNRSSVNLTISLVRLTTLNPILLLLYSKPWCGAWCDPCAQQKCPVSARC